MSLAKSIPTILAGSVMAGFGLSLGRDLYRWMKRYIGIVAIFVIPVALLLAPLLGVFIAFRAYALNDRNLQAAVKRKAIAGVTLGATLIVGAVPLMLLATIIPNPWQKADGLFSNGVIYWLEFWTVKSHSKLTPFRVECWPLSAEVGRDMPRAPIGALGMSRCGALGDGV